MGKRNGIGRGTRMGLSRLELWEILLLVFTYVAAFMGGFYFGRFIKEIDINVDKD